jgi:hypothetical protein
MINILKLTRIATTTALLAAGLLTAPTVDAASLRHQPNGAVRYYYDDGGYDRGYAWCRSGGSATRCDYFTVEQCRASGVPNATCVPNPFSFYVKP